jgi:hypothetical protein
MRFNLEKFIMLIFFRDRVAAARLQARELWRARSIVKRDQPQTHAAFANLVKI